jgi:uncharacterized glyoxalase superfamily protein PhnB
MKSITANLIVENIEDCLPFWERVGFEKTDEVPEEDRIGFVILAHEGTELMLQSRASMAKDVPEAADGPYRTALYIRVADLAPIREKLEGWPRVVPERTTFYGAREIIVRDPAGNLVSFAAFA